MDAGHQIGTGSWVAHAENRTLPRNHHHISDVSHTVHPVANLFRLSRLRLPGCKELEPVSNLRLIVHDLLVDLRPIDSPSRTRLSLHKSVI